MLIYNNEAVFRLRNNIIRVDLCAGGTKRLLLEFSRGFIERRAGIRGRHIDGCKRRLIAFLKRRYGCEVKRTMCRMRSLWRPFVSGAEAAGRQLGCIACRRRTRCEGWRGGLEPLRAEGLQHGIRTAGRRSNARLRQCLLDCSDDQSAHKTRISKTHISLGRMHINVDQCGVQRQKQYGNRMTIACHDISIGSAQRAEKLFVTHRTAIHISELMQGVAAIVGGMPTNPARRTPSRSASMASAFSPNSFPST